MKELKILIIIVFLTGITYWGVEPYAHSIMHPKVAPADFNYAQEDIDLAKSNLAKAKEEKASKQEIEQLSKNLDEYKTFWKEVDAIDLSKGNAKQGKELFANACAACHGAKIVGISAPMDDASASSSFGVVPPDLSSAGHIYEARFLAALIKNPPMALKLTHKFNADHPFAMPDYTGMGTDVNSEIADIVAYLQSIAPKTMSNKEVAMSACDRCHSIKYAGIHTTTNLTDLHKYLGSMPPDLSMMIRSEGPKFLEEFINDTQKMLPGTAMPRVGLTQEATKQVISYLSEVGDSKKEQREQVGLYAMIYFVILSILAILWKRKIWSKLH